MKLQVNYQKRREAIERLASKGHYIKEICSTLGLTYGKVHYDIRKFGIAVPLKGDSHRAQVLKLHEEGANLDEALGVIERRGVCRARAYQYIHESGLDFPVPCRVIRRPDIERLAYEGFSLKEIGSRVRNLVTGKIGVTFEAVRQHLEKIGLNDVRILARELRLDAENRGIADFGDKKRVLMREISGLVGYIAESLD
ncbi:hypothetical protein COU61_02045 [Candidatus Pacearchaeota archaeon CG10_big_fil_rev_8_21_14_0_10_35_13]|nr:MAG: hypothetical protein COU61_02045 [Candidatus Pacearchaeota archaeon CG10_big_fil_rev_8_21_14_0_10_35_13]